MAAHYFLAGGNMNGIIFWENGEVQILGQLNTVRAIALKVQEIIPSLVQQERDMVLDTMTEAEIRHAVERFGNLQKQRDMSDE